MGNENHKTTNNNKKKNDMTCLLSLSILNYFSTLFINHGPISLNNPYTLGKGIKGGFVTRSEVCAHTQSFGLYINRYVLILHSAMYIQVGAIKYCVERTITAPPNEWSIWYGLVTKNWCPNNFILGAFVHAIEQVGNNM